MVDSSSITFNGALEIDINKPIAHLTNEFSEGYMIKPSENHEGDKQYCVLVCRTDLSPRFRHFDMLSGVHAHFLKPLDFSYVQLPKNKRKMPAFLYDYPSGGAVCPSDANIPKLNEDDIIKKLIVPAIETLSILNNKRLAHRAVHHHNIFYSNEGQTSIYLGDCIIPPPGSISGALYETIDNAPLHRCARSSGTISEDLYALGVVISILLRGQNPFSEIDDEKIFFEKVEKTSYWFITEKLGASKKMSTLLYGLLADKQKNRWSLADVLSWLEGTTSQMKQIQAAPRSSKKSIEFGGKQHYSFKSLAYALSKNTKLAAKAIRNRVIEDWVGRSQGEIDIAKRIEYIRVKESTAPSKQTTLASGDSGLVCRICMILDPSGSIYFNDFSFSFDNIGTLLSFDYGNADLQKTFYEFVTSDLFRLAINSASSSNVQKSKYLQLLENLQNYITSTIPGRGIERCLYELNQTAYCRSLIFDSEYITDLTLFLQGLENKAKSGKKIISFPLERHLQAFLAAHSPSELNYFINELNHSGDTTKSVLSLLNIFAFLQKQYYPKSCKNLSEQFAPYAGILSNLFHNRAKRLKMAKSIEAIAKEGSFSKILVLLSKSESKIEDIKDFKIARYKFHINSKNIRKILDKDRGDEVQMLGENAAAIISLVIGMVGFAFSLLILAG